MVVIVIMLLGIIAYISYVVKRSLDEILKEKDKVDA
jgi:hypothetical protein